MVTKGELFAKVEALETEIRQLREDKAKLLTALRGDFHADTCPCDACAYRKFVLRSVKP